MVIVAVQPPSGGCVLKPFSGDGQAAASRAAAFGRLCVETPQRAVEVRATVRQPPSGGCVLKRLAPRTLFRAWIAAAFGRLCVETKPRSRASVRDLAAAFGRLCVETPRRRSKSRAAWQPPSGGCVLKPVYLLAASVALNGSRLRAAVC